MQVSVLLKKIEGRLFVGWLPGGKLVSLHAVTVRDSRWMCDVLCCYSHFCPRGGRRMSRIENHGGKMLPVSAPLSTQAQPKTDGRFEGKKAVRHAARL